MTKILYLMKSFSGAINVLFTFIICITIVSVIQAQNFISANPTPITSGPSGCIRLPMQFGALHAKRNSSQVSVTWEVTYEEAVTNYFIERSNNGTDFITVALIGNKAGNDYVSKYTFSDVSAGNNTNVFYRIKAQTAAGQNIYSNIIALQPDLREGELKISPVPAIGYVTIKWPSTANNNLTITLYDITGCAVQLKQFKVKKGVNELLFTKLETLPAGTYFLKASDGISDRTGKLMIHHNL